MIKSYIVAITLALLLMLVVSSIPISSASVGVNYSYADNKSLKNPLIYLDVGPYYKDYNESKYIYIKSLGTSLGMPSGVTIYLNTTPPPPPPPPPPPGEISITTKAGATGFPPPPPPPVPNNPYINVLNVNSSLPSATLIITGSLPSGSSGSYSWEIEMWYSTTQQTSNSLGKQWSSGDVISISKGSPYLYIGFSMNSTGGPPPPGYTPTGTTTLSFIFTYSRGVVVLYSYQFKLNL
ncbi:MAG: hypothetical protein QW578_07935 [Thermoplasmatales archaeon]